MGWELELEWELELGLGVGVGDGVGGRCRCLAKPSRWTDGYALVAVAEPGWRSSRSRRGPMSVNSPCRSLLSTLPRGASVAAFTALTIFRLAVLPTISTYPLESAIRTRWTGSGNTRDNILRPSKALDAGLNSSSSNKHLGSLQGGGVRPTVPGAGVMVNHRSPLPPATSSCRATSEGVERIEKTVDRDSVCPASFGGDDHQLVVIGEQLGRGRQ